MYVEGRESIPQLLNLIPYAGRRRVVLERDSIREPGVELV